MSGTVWPKAIDAADKTSAVFEPLIEELMIVRRSTVGLTKAVNAFAKVVEKPDLQIESNAKPAGERLLARIDEIAARIRKAQISNRESQIESLNNGLNSSARELNMLSSLTLITTAHVAHADFDRQSFADDTRGMSARLLDSAAQIGTFMEGVRSNRSQIEKSLQGARKQLARVMAVQNGPSGEGGPQASSDAGQAVSQAAAFKDRIAGSTQSMVACMQHPDALRQRADHVDAIMDKVTEVDSEAGAALQAVASAHCANMAEELSTIIDEATAALNDMIRSGLDTAQELRNRIAADDRSAALTRHHNVITETISSVIGAHRETSKALSGLQKMQGMLDEIRGLFTSLQRERDIVRLSAFNASIAERRLGSSTLGMNVVAMATRDSAEQCSVTVESMTTLMTDITNDATAIDTPALENAFCETEQAVSADQETLVQLIADADAVTSAAQACEDSIEGLLKAAKAATLRLSKITPAIGALQALSQALSHAVVDTPPSQSMAASTETALAVAYATYTMESERRVHLDVITRLGYQAGNDPKSPEAASAPPAATEDDDCLDSILF